MPVGENKNSLFIGDFDLSSVQRRKHRKKRINKKWAKRYGFKTVYKNVRVNDVTYDFSENGEIDILGKEARVICD